MRWRRRRHRAPLRMAAIEIVQILPHLFQRKSQREKPLRDIDGHAADQALAAQRGDLGAIGPQRRIDRANVHGAAAASQAT